MAFRPLFGYDGKIRLRGVADAVTVTKGDAMVDNGSGYLTTASAGGGADVRFVAMETVTTTADNQQVLVVDTDGVTFSADVDAAAAQTDVGTEADLAAAGQVDPNASADDIFYIEAIDGVVGTSTVVIGHFTRGVMNS